MPDNKKHVLIIDDDIGTMVDEEALFKNSGADVEVFVARRLDEGMEKLKEWAAQGHRADIIDSDYYVARGFLDDFKINNHAANQGYNGLSALEYIMKWAESQPEAVRPPKYFMHSKVHHDAWQQVNAIPALKGKVDVYGNEELLDIGSLGEREGYFVSNRAPTQNYREYCNKTLGTRFPLTDAQLRLLQEPNAKISLQEAYYEAKEDGMEPEKALKIIDISKLADDFRDRIDHSKAEAELGPSFRHNQPDFDLGVGQAMTGHLAFSAEQAQALRQQGKKAILVLQEFTPQDTQLLSVADGIVLLGKGSEHLEVVVANHNIPAVMGNNHGVMLQIEESDGKKRLSNKPGGYMEPGKYVVNEGDAVTIAPGGITVDWRTDKEIISGDFYKGALPIERHDPFEYEHTADMYNTVIGWADDARQKHNGYAVKANADTPEQVASAIELGAEGIGLLRTEHMFFAPDRLAALQKALLTDDAEEKQAAFAALKQHQKNDFAGIFAAADKAGRDFPVTIRLLDAPPEEFFNAEQVAALSAKVGAGNTRAVQLAQKIPGLYAMQAEAIFEAAKESGYKGKFDVMIPLVRDVAELRAVKAEIAAVANKYGMKGRYQLRAMVETKEAVEHAADIAKEVDGISFGTNDLTAEAMGGVKRDDVAAAREWMAEHNHVGKSPFLTLAKPVKAMMQQTVEAARKANPAIDIGICGHQVAGDPASLEFCQQIGLDSVSAPASAQHLIASRVIAGQAAQNHPRERAPETSAKVLTFAAKRQPRIRFTDDVPIGTTSPDNNDRESRDEQWEISK